MPDIRLLTADEWVKLRNIRLAALQESPQAFLSTYERENVYDADWWRAEFIRGNWYTGILAGRSVSLLGVTREPGMPVHECYLEYMWVSPEHRRSGMAIGMLTMVLECLRAADVRTVFVWVLDGNGAARNLYERIGFVDSNHRQALAERPDRSEERLILTLAKPGSLTAGLGHSVLTSIRRVSVGCSDYMARRMSIRFRNGRGHPSLDVHAVRLTMATLRTTQGRIGTSRTRARRHEFPLCGTRTA